jgi:alanyl-tRNA synthetase
LRKLASDLRQENRRLLVVVASAAEGKAFVAIGIGDDLLSSRSLDATRMIKEQVTPLLRGGGGGQKSLATAGGLDASRFPEIIDGIKAQL